MNNWVPQVGDMVQVDIRGVPGVGIIVEVKDEYILVDGARWREKFHPESVKYLEPELSRDSTRC